MTAAAMHRSEAYRAPSGAPSWEREGRDWPNRAASRFVRAGGLRWHVQVMGAGPVVLLIHGTGAATHSWRDLMPLLARDFTVVTPDLPGHGFTEKPSDLSLPGMASRVSSLLETLAVSPHLAVGHSAGAAILARMCIDGRITPSRLVALNGALLPLAGLPGHVFAPAARLLAVLPGVPYLFSRHASDKRSIERLLRDTGSRVDPAAVEYYGRLVACPGHVAGTLRMMSQWALEPLARDLPRLATKLLLLAGVNDRTVPAEDSRRVAALVPGARAVLLPGLGHMAHEEEPAMFARLIAEAA